MKKAKKRDVKPSKKVELDGLKIELVPVIHAKLEPNGNKVEPEGRGGQVGVKDEKIKIEEQDQLSVEPKPKKRGRPPKVKSENAPASSGTRRSTRNNASGV